MGDWAVYLNGVGLGGCAAIDCETVDMPVGTLTAVPDGLGLPGLRTEDVTFVQRDGVTHFSDWYEPRIITLQASVCGGVCPCGEHEGTGLTSKQAVRELAQAWGRQCDDVELVIYTDCHGQDAVDDGFGFGEGPFGEGPFGGVTTADRSVNGPFGVKGRPRVFQVQPIGGVNCADILLRFDARDHRMYVLDDCGTPGSGGECVTVQPGVAVNTRCYTGSGRCYTGSGMCYDVPPENPPEPAVATVVGDGCAEATITLNGPLTAPIVIENETTGQAFVYNADVSGVPVVIDPEARTATQGGSNRTNNLSGSFSLQPGNNELQLQAGGTGDMEVCWRNVVFSA